MNDYILRSITADGSARLFTATTRHTVNEMQAMHRTAPAVTAALGRLLTGAAIMGMMLGDDSDMLTISIRGDGPAQGLLVTADSTGSVKGYAHVPQAIVPNKENGKLDVAAVVGGGTMTVIKDMGLKDPYVGKIELVSGEIAEDLAHYFAQSEQTPSAVALGVLVGVDYSVEQAGGLILQMLPGADDAAITRLEHALDKLPPLTQLLSAGSTPEDITDMLLGECGYSVLGRQEVGYACNCSQERVERALEQVGREELEKILNHDGQAEVLCHFCNQKYIFNELRLRNMLESLE